MDVRALKDEAAGYFGRGRFSKAAPLYAKLAQLEPDNPQHLLRQGDCLRHDGKKDKAIEIYQQAAAYHTRHGSLLKAIAAFKMILELSPEHELTRLQMEDLSRRHLSTRTMAPAYVPRAKAEQAAPPSDTGMEFELEDSNATLSRTATSDPSAMDLEPPSPVLEEDSESPPLEEVLLGRDTSKLVVAPPPPKREEPQALELDLEPSTPTPVQVRAAASPIEPIELGLPQDEATPALSAVVEPPAAIELDDPSAPTPTLPLPVAPVMAKTRAEAAIIAAAESIALREETPIGHVVSDSIHDDFVDPTAIGLVALAPEEELNPDDVAQQTLPLFSDLPHAAFVEILRESVLRRIQFDEVIIREGEVGQSFFVLIRGAAKVVKQKNGGEVELARIAEGAFFGEVALLNGEPRMASVIATEECDLLEISQTLLRQLSSTYPGVSRSIVHFYKERLLANVLSLSPLFRALDPADRPPLLRKFELRDVKPDTVVLTEGQKAEGLYVVMNGAALVTKNDGPDKTRPLALLREGDVFGEMSLLTRKPVSATVTAKGTTILLMLPKKEFDEVILTYPVVLEAVSELNDLRLSLNENALSGTDVTRSGSLPRV